MGVISLRLVLAAASLLATAACSPRDQPVGGTEAQKDAADCDSIVAAAEARADEIAKDPALSETDKEIATVRVWSKTGQCGLRPEPADAPQSGDISEELTGLYREAMMAARAANVPGADCRSQIGDSKADALEAICAQVSGATHPPCNAANCCDLLVDEVERNCDSSMAAQYPKLCSAAHASAP